MEKFKVIARPFLSYDRSVAPSKTKYGICYADSFPIQWEDVGQSGTFKQCLDSIRTKGDTQLRSEWYVAENYYTKQILLIIISPNLPIDHDGWSNKLMGEEAAFNYIEQWRRRYGAGLTHAVIERDGMGARGPYAYNYQVFPLTGSIPDGWHFDSFAGTEEECRKGIESRMANWGDDDDDNAWVL